jgi:hypothetical protein
MPIAPAVANSAESTPVPRPMIRLLASPAWKSLMISRRAYHSVVQSGGNGQTLFDINDR